MGIDRARLARQRGGHVYFITDGNAIKIGFSTDVLYRLGGLQVGHPAELRLLADFVGSTLDEANILRRFEHLNLRGEWFKHDPEIIDFIAELEKVRDYIESRHATLGDALKGTIGDIIARHTQETGMLGAIRALRRWGRRQPSPIAERTLIIAEQMKMYARQPIPLQFRELMAKNMAGLERMKQAG